MQKLNNIFLFTGEGKYLLNKELDLRKSKFIQKYGDSSLFVLNQPADLEITKIQQLIFSGGLFSPKKLIIIYGLPADTDPANKLPSSQLKEIEQFFLTNLTQIPPDTVLVFVSFKPDKRWKLFKTLSQQAQVKNFTKLKPAQIKQIIAQQLPQLSTQNIEFLTNLIGNDEQKLTTELHKLKNLSTKLEALTTQDLKEIVSDSSIFNIFNWLDKFISSPAQRKDLLATLKIDEDPLNIAGALLWSFKNIIVFYEASQRGISSNQIVSLLKAPPFVISKISSYRLEAQDLQQIKQRFIKINQALEAIKRGILPQENLSFFIKQILLDEKAIHSPN